MEFQAGIAAYECINWIKQYFLENGPNSKAVIGISGGKDSSVAAALCVEAIGKENVIGVMMPQDTQNDIAYAKKLISELEIPSIEINIGNICTTFYTTLIYSNEIFEEDGLKKSVTTNLPARVRMTVLYAIAAQLGGRVVNTCNLSEDYVGYSTKFGDSAGDFAPLAKLTSSEVCEIGKSLGLSNTLMDKKPEDGLSGLTDEENLGFSYKTLNSYIRENIYPVYQVYRNIEERHKNNLHKISPMPMYVPSVKVFKY